MGDILFLAHRVPYPPDRGDKIRAFNILKFLAERERVHLIAFADVSGDLRRGNGLAPYLASASIIWRSKPRGLAAVEAFWRRKPVSLTAFDNRAVREAVEATLSRHAIDTIYVYSSQMAQYLPAQPRPRVIMDFVDMDSAKFAAYADTSRWPAKWLMRREAALLFTHERSVARTVDASVFVSEAEAALFRTRSGADRVDVVENGIDAEHYSPDAAFVRIARTGPLIVFTGQMDYRPNAEAVSWFVDSVLPHIRLRHPTAQFAIVGRNPGEAVRRLAGSGVIVTGEVADVRGWIAAASVVVAPLLMARGVQNKVLEAMAMARVVVASPAAGEGIDHAGTIRTGDGVGAFADEVIALLDDPAAAAAIGRDARRHVIARYGWRARLAALDPVLTAPVRASARLAS